jgi:predicted amidohydrolase
MTRLVPLLVAGLAACGPGAGPADDAGFARPAPPGARTLRVAAVQFDARPEEPERNRQAMERLLREAVAGGARLVLFHENGLVDYGPRVHELAEEVPGGPTSRHFAGLAAELGVWVGIGLPERAEDPGGAPRYHITQAYFGPAGYVGRYRKAWLFHNRHERRRDEWAFYDPGEGPSELLELAGLRTATLICADADSERCLRRLRELGPELVLFPNNRSDFHAPETFADVARRAGAPLLAANRSGDSWQHACNGGSFLLDREGRTLARANRAGRDEVLICDLPLD